MYLITCYQNGKRYVSSLNPSLVEGSEWLIDGDEVKANSEIYPDGTRYDTIAQKITDEEINSYKKDPFKFTAKQVFSRDRLVTAPG